MSSESVTANVTPIPTDEEAAAILAAYEALWPRPVLVDQPDPSPTNWRFSGRWWGPGRRLSR